MIPVPNSVTCSGCPSPLLEFDQPSVPDIPAASSLSITLTHSDAVNMGSKFWPKRGSPGTLHHFVCPGAPLCRMFIISLLA